MCSWANATFSPRVYGSGWRTHATNHLLNWAKIPVLLCVNIHKFVSAKQNIVPWSAYHFCSTKWFSCLTPLVKLLITSWWSFNISCPRELGLQNTFCVVLLKGSYFIAHRSCKQQYELITEQQRHLKQKCHTFLMTWLINQKGTNKGNLLGFISTLTTITTVN